MLQNDASDSVPERILEKIKKCLALSKSTNANEANIALKQARKLMDQYKVDSTDMDAFNASETRLLVGKRPSSWAIRLGCVCAEAFGCAIIVRKRHQYAELQYLGVHTELSFIGIGSYPELASYAYDVLARQLGKARQEFVRGLSGRCKLSTKRRRGDIFADAWISSVHQLIAEFSGSDAESIAAIEAYKRTHFPDLKTLDIKLKKVTTKDQSARQSGYTQGKKASLYKPVDNDKTDHLAGVKRLSQLDLI